MDELLFQKPEKVSRLYLSSIVTKHFESKDSYIQMKLWTNNKERTQPFRILKFTERTTENMASGLNKFNPNIFWCGWILLSFKLFQELKSNTSLIFLRKCLKTDEKTKYFKTNIHRSNAEKQQA